jgi:hypothetical protein
MRNKELTGFLTGYREPGGGTLLDPLKTFTGTLGSWLIARPPLGNGGGIYLNWNDFSPYMRIAGVLVWAFLLVALVGFVSRLRRQQHDAKIIIASCALIFLAYSGFSVYRFVYHEMGPLDSRMMSGLYVPIIVFIVIALDSLRCPKWLGVLSTLLFLFPAWHAATTVSNSIEYGRSGRHWGTESHRAIPIHQFVASLPADAALYSNEPQSLFAATYRWPIRNQYMYQIPYNLPCSRRYFVWFNESFLPDGRPVGGNVLYEDSSGQVIDLDTCNTDISRFWP